MTATVFQALALDIVSQQTVAHHQVGRPQEAKQLCSTILQACPNRPAASHNLDVRAVQAKQFAVSFPRFNAATGINQNYGQYCFIYMGALIHASQSTAVRQVLACYSQNR